MGYYTRHSLTVTGQTDFNIDYESEIGDLTDYINCLVVL